MSIHALAWALSTETGSPTRKAVLLALADRYNEDEKAAWPSIGWIARVTELSPRTVKRAVQELEEAGLLQFVGWSAGRLDRRTKRYRLLIHRQGSTGCQSVTSKRSRGDTLSARGDSLSITGCQSVTLTIREPLDNRDTVDGVSTVDGVDAMVLDPHDHLQACRSILGGTR